MMMLSAVLQLEAYKDGTNMGIEIATFPTPDDANVTYTFFVGEKKRSFRVSKNQFLFFVETTFVIHFPEFSFELRAESDTGPA